MNNKFTPDELFKKGLTQTDFEYDEAMWEKIQSKLEAKRKEKKDKKRWLVLLFMFLLTGGAAYFVINEQRKEKQNSIAVDNTAAGSGKLSGNEKSLSVQEKNNLEENIVNESTASPLVKQPDLVAANKTPNPESIAEGNFNIYKSSGGINRLNKKGNVQKETGENDRTNPIAAPADKNEAEVKLLNPQDVAPVNSLTEQTITPAIDNNKTEMKPEAAPVKEETVSKAVAKNEKQKSTEKSRWYINSGGDISMPFNKIGFQAGVTWVNTSDDNKRLFTGISIINHKLKHQYISASKINTPSPETDAVIERMTALRFSVGYLFDLNAKRNRDNTFLSLGFEPSYAINLRTIYYDRNGQPSGPATLIVNSPIMDKAINRFNLFFTASIQKEFKNRLGVSLKAGYGFIPVTNKEFYNRTTGNNNIRSLQAGFIYRLK